MKKMRERWRKIFIKAFAAVVAAALLCSAFCGCAKKEGAGSHYLGSFLGADVYLILTEDIPSISFEAMIKECERSVGEYERTFSLKSEESDISAFNNLSEGQKTEVCALTKSLVDQAKALYEITGGAFNPAVYPLVDLWGFSYRFDSLYEPEKAYDRIRNADGSFDLPNERFVEAFKSLCDFSAVEAFEEDGKYYLKKNCPSVTVDGVEYNQQIDLSAFLKGDLCYVLTWTVSKYAKDFYLSLGTSSLYLSAHGVYDWNVQLVDPKSESRDAFCAIPLSYKSVATSGVYENNYTVGGRTYHHIIDAATGRSAATDILSVAVIGDDGLICDAYSTAIVVMGLDKAKDFIRKTSGYNFVIVTNDDEVWSDIDVVPINKNYTYLKF